MICICICIHVHTAVPPMYLFCIYIYTAIPSMYLFCIYIYTAVPSMYLFCIYIHTAVWSTSTVNPRRAPVSVTDAQHQTMDLKRWFSAPHRSCRPVRLSHEGDELRAQSSNRRDMWRGKLLSSLS